MSYILDALKKSEKERCQGRLPDLTTVQDAPAKVPQRRTLWPYLLLAALVLNAGILFWWLGHRNTEKSPPPAQAPVFEQTAPAIARNTITPAGRTDFHAARPAFQDAATAADIDTFPADVKPASEKGGRLEAKAAAIAAPVQQAAAEALPPPEKKLYRLRELPAALLRDLPAFSVAALLYDRDPASRMARINDRMMREGQDLSQGLKLEEIIEDGVIFRFRDYRFFVGMK